MKFLKTVLCLTLLLEIFTGVLTEPVEDGLHLAHKCVQTKNEEKNDGAPIVLLHGFTGFLGMFLELADELALKTTRKVCAVDLRNHGDSPWSDQLDSKSMASDINLLVETLGTEKIILMGHSLGGKVAIEFALTYPEKVEKLIVEDMRPNGMDADYKERFSGNLDYLRDVLQMIPEGATEKEARQAVGVFYKELYNAYDESMVFDEKAVDAIPIKCSDGTCSWKTNLDVLDKMQEDPIKYIPDSSGKCEKPALFIYGEASPLKVGDVEEEILELFPNAKLYAVKDGRHIIDYSPEFREEVIKFINTDE